MIKKLYKVMNNSRVDKLHFNYYLFCTRILFLDFKFQKMHFTQGYDC